MNDLQKQSLYGSHLPILTRLMEVTNGPVLELGMGLWSTPMLDLMCANQGRTLHSFDNDFKWYKENEKWQSDYHEVTIVSDWKIAGIDHIFWSIAFVDQRPAIERKDQALRLAKNALFVVLHDSEPEQDKYFKYSRIYKHFKYRYDYTTCRPHTTILSNFIDPKILL